MSSRRGCIRPCGLSVSSLARAGFVDSLVWTLGSNDLGQRIVWVCAYRRHLVGVPWVKCGWHALRGIRCVLPAWSSRSCFFGRGQLSRGIRCAMPSVMPLVAGLRGVPSQRPWKSLRVPGPDWHAPRHRALFNPTVLPWLVGPPGSPRRLTPGIASEVLGVAFVAPRVLLACPGKGCA
jgi:hypothetical protein